VLSQSGAGGEAILGIGIDFTSCTVLPATGSGVPLCMLPAYRNLPHAWPKLWKHHAAQPQADRVNALAAERGEPWLPRYGGKISSEWLLPKALQLLEEAPDLYVAADLLIEGGDWVTWQLTGKLARNVCAAGYKATWHRRDGFPSPAYLSALNPAFASLYEEKVRGPLLAPGQAVGALTPEWAARLGLSTETIVAAPIIDAHAGVLGAGVTTTGVMVLAMGTSTCHMLMSESEQLVEGISGVVEGGIVPGLFGYEAGQAGVGDMFAWYVENSVPPPWHEEASRRDVSLHDVLVERARALRPGASGLRTIVWLRVSTCARLYPRIAPSSSSASRRALGIPASGSV
jgi:L-ribulokinase